MKKRFDDDDEFFMVCLFLAVFFTFAITILIIWDM